MGMNCVPIENPLRLHFHNCVFYFRFLYVILVFNFVGDPNMNRPLLYHCNSPFSFHCFTFEQLSKSALETIFFRFLFATRVCYAVVQFKIVHTTHRVRIVLLHYWTTSWAFLSIIHLSMVVITNLFTFVNVIASYIAITIKKKNLHYNLS